MPCSACVSSALRCFLNAAEATRAAGLRARTVRYYTIETLRHPLHNNSSTPRIQLAHTSLNSTLQPLQLSGLHAVLSPVEGPGRRKELSHRDRTGSMIGIKGQIRINEHSRQAAQTASLQRGLRSRQDSTKFEGFPTPQPSIKNEASFNQDPLKENMKAPGQLVDAMSGWPKDAFPKGYSRSPKLAGPSRKARLRGDSRAVEVGLKGAKRSSRSTKAAADSRNSTQDYKDRREPWQIQKCSLSEKFGTTGWLPRKRLSPDTLDGIRALHSQYPDKFTTPILADQFKVSPEAIRRILKSKWRPNDKEEERRTRRWEKRGEIIWSQMVEVGIKPPKKWRDMGLGKSRERKPAQIEQLKSQVKPKSKVTSSLLDKSTSNLHTIPANRHETGLPVPLADRIL